MSNSLDVSVVEVTQADLDAVSGFFRNPRTPLSVKMVLGCDPAPLLDAFARHRIAATRTTLESTRSAVEAAADALAGWRYIRLVHGDLPGVGWDRVEGALTAALSLAGGEMEK